jgi:polyhydroxybutyrate depolymerase
MGDDALGQAVSGLGLALIAPQSAGRSWASQGSPFFAATGGVGELPYIAAVAEDAAARFPIDRGRILASGISAGGMLVWTVACLRGDLFAGFLPFAGALWAPMPEVCPAPPAMLRHVHARHDPVVPLEGGPAPIAGFTIGNVFAAMEVMARSGGFGLAAPERLGGLACEVRRDARGGELSLCLHDGGHDYRVEDVLAAWHDLARRATPGR